VAGGVHARLPLRHRLGGRRAEELAMTRKTGNEGPADGLRRFKSKRHSVRRSASWKSTISCRVGADRHHIRLILPQSSPDLYLVRRRHLVGWLHTVESTASVPAVESGEATIQKLTISHQGGRWRAAFQVRYRQASAPSRRSGSGRWSVSISASATWPPSRASRRAQRRAMVTSPTRASWRSSWDGSASSTARSPEPRPGSKSRRRLVRRRARLHGRVAQTRALHLHRLSTRLAGAFEVVAIEDLNVKAWPTANATSAGVSAMPGWAELRRQLTYKTTDRGHALVAVGRFYPSSKTCSHCGAVKAKLPRGNGSQCDGCGTSVDRDVNAARSIAGKRPGSAQPRRHAGPARRCRATNRTPKTPPRDQVRPPKRKPRGRVA